MLRLYPKDKSLLDFDKIRLLLSDYCNGSPAMELAKNLAADNDYDAVKKMLLQASEFTSMLRESSVIPIKYSINLFSELNLLRIDGALLHEEQFYNIRELAMNIEAAFHFFKLHPDVYPALQEIISQTKYEKNIVEFIEAIIDTDKTVRSNASRELLQIRIDLSKKRIELNRQFERAISRLAKDGMLVDTEQSIRNGRRVVAVFSEHKRQVKGFLHGLSDTGKTSFIEPEETVELNNRLYELEQEERREIVKILRELTARLKPFQSLLMHYQNIIVNYDLLYAKAKLAVDMNGAMPIVSKQSIIHLVKAKHPLLLLHNKKLNKETIPLSLQLNHEKRILIISGPNAGGKTICLKLVGLLQIMMQAGLLIPVAPESEMGIFNTVMISIGDTQSIEYELSTYSAHLKIMKHFCLYADKHTLFLIDELGSGSDPTLGGAFAEAILETLATSKAIGIVTTHYMNLKTLANRYTGIINGAMEFDEKNLLPLYQLQVGKPGSSYTFAIAERIGIPRKVSDRARELVKQDHFKVENLLRDLQKEKQLLQEKEKLFLEYERGVKQ
ncbi:MAG: DNA mismatch repair protein MutS, partial [Bacteroidota bacterium]